MSDDLDMLAGRARDELTRAVDAAAPPAPPLAEVARRAASRRVRRAAFVVAALVTVGSGALWSAMDDGPSSKVVAGRPRRTPEASGNRCFRPTYLPAGFVSGLLPGPAYAGGPSAGSLDEVFHWGQDLMSIDVSVADTNSFASAESRFPVLGAEASAGTVSDSGGGTHEYVSFPACGRAWVLSSTRTGDGRGVPAGEVRRVAEGLIPGDPNHEDPTGVTGILYAYAKPDPQTPIPIEGPAPGAGPTAGRVVAVRDGAEAARAEVAGDGRFTLELPAGLYDILGSLGDGRPCGQERVTVVDHRVRNVTLTCQR